MLTRCVPLFGACLAGFLFPLHAQVHDTLTAAEPVEALLEQIESEAENSELLDRLNWLQEHPLDLNNASREELSSIPLLTPGDVDAILAVRTRLSRFTNIEQTELIEGVGWDVLEKIRPYVTVARQDEPSRLSVDMRSRFLSDMQRRKGFRDGSFTGSPLKGYTRLSVWQSENLHAGALFEKDAGEKTGNGFVSAYLAVNHLSFLSRAVVGDYTIEAGQGVVLWRASAFGKGGEAVSVVKKSGLTIQPYRSTDEFHVLRGVAATSGAEIGGGRLDVTAFYSRRALAASGDETSVTSLYKEGLFRTESEMKRRSNIVERIVGGRTTYTSRENWVLGTTIYTSRFSKPLVAGRVFDFAGTSATVAGLDAEVNLGWLSPTLSQITLFGEAARSENGAVAGITGSILNFTRGAHVALVYRYYSPRFTSLHSAGFGERSDTKNERGFYFGVEMRVSRLLHLSGYVDHFASPWRTFDNPLPTGGRDLVLQADAKPAGRLAVQVRYANKTVESRQASVDTLNRESRLLVDRRQQKLRLSAAYQAGKQVRLKGRAELTAVAYNLIDRSEEGWLLYQDMRYVPVPSLSVEARLVFYHTDSYDSRLYEYENDLRGVFANPALYGRGRRWYVLLRWHVMDVVELSAKYAETQKDGVKTLGSGLTEIEGDVDNRISMQVEVRL